MGIMDTVARTILDVKVQGVAEAKAQLSDLSRTERKVADDRIAGLEAGNAGLEKWIGVLGQVGVAIGVAKVAFDSFNEYAHHLDLESAAAGVSIDGLAKAAHGLKTNMELLEHAAIFNKSAFKLTQDQMETVETAMRALEARGRNSAEVWAAMESAVTKGATKPLEQFGVIIDKTGLAVDENGLKLDTYGQKQKALERIMKGLATTAVEVKDEHMNAADSMNQTIVALRNYWDEAKLKLGEMVTQLKPLVDGLADAVKNISQLASLVPKGAWGGGLGAFKAGDSSMLHGASDWIANHLGSGSLSDGASSAADRLAYNQMLAQFMKNAQGSGPDQWGGGSGGTVDAGAFYSFWDSTLSKYLKKKTAVGGFDLGITESKGIYVGGDPSAVTNGSIGASPINNKALQKIIDDIKRAEGLAGIGRAVKSQKEKDRDNALTTIFGPIDQWKAYDIQIATLGKTFSAFTDAVGASYEAIVTGQGSVSKAFKTVLADGLMAMGKSSAIDALRETALGFASLALGPIGGASAALHFQAAGLHAAVAVAAGVAANQIGTSSQAAAADKQAAAQAKGTSTGTGGGSHASSGGGSSSGGGKQQPIINNFIVGDWFANQSLRERQREAERTVKLATGGSVGQDS